MQMSINRWTDSLYPHNGILFGNRKKWKADSCCKIHEGWKHYVQWMKILYIYTAEYYSAIKRNKIRSSGKTWMDLETVIQSKVSQKEKNKHCILMHMYGIWKKKKTGIDNLIYKAEIETQTERTNVWMPRGKQGWDELGGWQWHKFTTDIMYKMDK